MKCCFVSMGIMAIRTEGGGTCTVCRWVAVTSVMSEILIVGNMYVSCCWVLTVGG